MRRASYRLGIEWIALNDETAESDPDVLSELVSVALLADLFGIETRRVAEDVTRYRSKHPIENTT